MMTEALDLSILGPAFLAGLLVLSTHVPMGQEVLRRGIIFIDLAIAQVAGLGVILIHSLMHDPQDWQVQIAAALAALAGAWLLAWTERRAGPNQEAIIGVIFILAASMSLILLADNPHGGERLQDLLVGQILWVDVKDLMSIGLLYALLLFIWFGMRNRMGRMSFYFLFALNVMASVQLVGIYLVFASLIIPALATLNAKHRLLVGYVLGAMGYLVGLVLSAITDLPSGAVIVMVLGMLGVGFGFILNRQSA
jgi:zinc/manganese transport system permease protein